MIRGIDGEQVQLRLILSESRTHDGQPLYKRIVDVLRAEGLAGATVLKGVAGFGPDSIIHQASLLRLSADLPLVIEVVDTQEHLDAVLPEVDRMMGGGLITMEKVRVVRYEQGG